MTERPDGADEDTLRVVAAFVRAEFQAPVAGLRSLIDGLAEDAASAGLDAYGRDIASMRAAADRLLGLVADLLDAPDAGAAAASGRSLRHDLRTPVSSVIGYAELIAEEAREAGHAALFAPLADVLDGAVRLLHELDRLVTFSGALSDAGAPGTTTEVPEILRHAAAFVQSLGATDPNPARAPIGRILVVDDNASMRDLVSRRLARDGHAVSTCSDGAVALDMCGDGAFDLMLLDLMMPGLSGLDVLARLRARPETRTLPVIVMSALDEVEAAVRCIEEGADDFLSKPLNETLLRARLASSLERKFLRDREQGAAERLRREQERSDALLRNVLPESVVERLRAGEATVADHFDEVTVMFCDLVGFTALSAAMSPPDTIAMLNAVFSGFDRLAEENGLEKIKTVGDAYMVVGGMSGPPDGHAARIARMALRMPDVAARAVPRVPLSVRIGIDTGPAIGGIIGTRKFFYDVWGDTVNTASRLESLSEPGRIHVSSATRSALGPAFRCTARDPIPVKGKGMLHTFYVEGLSSAPSPEPAASVGSPKPARAG